MRRDYDQSFLNRIKPDRDPCKALVLVYWVIVDSGYSDLYIDSVDEVDLANLFWALAQLLCCSGALLRSFRGLRVECTYVCIYVCLSVCLYVKRDRETEIMNEQIESASLRLS